MRKAFGRTSPRRLIVARRVPQPLQVANLLRLDRLIKPVAKLLGHLRLGRLIDKRLLGLPPHGPYALLLCTVDPIEPTATSAVRDICAAHHLASVWCVRGDTELGIVALGRTTPARLLEQLRPAVCGRLGLSSVFNSLHEVPEAHRMAGIALRTVEFPVDANNCGELLAGDKRVFWVTTPTRGMADDEAKGELSNRPRPAQWKRAANRVGMPSAPPQKIPGTGYQPGYATIGDPYTNQGS